MCPDKADRSSAIVVEMLYSTCFWETGTVKVLDLNCNIISRISTINWYESKIDRMYIHVGGALNRGLKLIKQLIRVFECISERHMRQRVEVDEMQCRFISATEVAPDF